MRAVRPIVGVYQILVLPPRLDEVFRDVRVSEDFHLLIKQTILHLKGQAKRPGHFLKLLIEGKLLLKVFVLLLTGPLGLAESFFMLRLGLGHELRILRRVRFLQILDVPQKRLILLINLGDGCGCGIGVGQNILHPLEVGFLLHRLTQLFHLGGGEFGVLGNFRQFFLNLDLFKLPARLRELGNLFVVSGKSLGSTIGGGFGGLAAGLVDLLLVFPELFDGYGRFLAVIIELLLCADSILYRLFKDITLLEDRIDLFLKILLFAFGRLIVNLIHTLNSLSRRLCFLCYSLITPGNQSIKIHFPLFLCCKRGIIL